jgi:hypothetical protein
MKLSLSLSYTNKNVFFFSKNRKQEDKIGPVWGAGNSGRGENMKKGSRRVNMV